MALAQEIPPGLAVASLNPGMIETEMLHSCFGDSAASYPDPAQWAQSAGPYLLSLDADDNGRQLTVPGVQTKRV